MVWKNPDNETIKKILETPKTIAVVGLSDKPERASHEISRIMKNSGYKIIPVNPMVDEVHGEKAYPSLHDVDEKIDIINVFRRPEYLLDIAKEAVQTDAKVFWAQQGIINEKAYHYLNDHNFTVIMDMCIKVAHSVLIGNKK